MISHSFPFARSFGISYLIGELSCINTVGTSLQNRRNQAGAVSCLLTGIPPACFQVSPLRPASISRRQTEPMRCLVSGLQAVPSSCLLSQFLYLSSSSCHATSNALLILSPSCSITPTSNSRCPTGRTYTLLGTNVR